MGYNLDGISVDVGTQLYDVIHGYGVVIELKAADRFCVSFASNAQRVYDSAGIQSRFPRRTLYWHDPVLMLPPADGQKWDLAKRIAEAATGEIMRP